MPFCPSVEGGSQLTDALLGPRTYDLTFCGGKLGPVQIEEPARTTVMVG